PQGPEWGPSAPERARQAEAVRVPSRSGHRTDLPDRAAKRFDARRRPAGRGRTAGASLCRPASGRGGPREREGYYPGRMPMADQKTVLLVEDNEDNRIVYATMLEHYGYRVVETANGEDAVRIAREELPDLILMDISIPGI